MRVITVDDEPISREIMQFQLESIPSINEVFAFSSPEEVLSWLKDSSADIAFLDIIMDGMNGIDLATEIKKVCPKCRVVFVSGSKDYTLDAFNIHADGYLLKPVTQEDILKEIDYIKEYAPVKKSDKILKVQCFGNFEIFNKDGVPIKFKYKKSKELLAYLIHRCGTTCNLKEIAAVLYEDRVDSDSLQSQMRNLVADISKTLKAIGAESVLYRNKSDIGIVTEKVDCDYYEFNNGNQEAINNYNGEFMNQYSWADVTLAYLDNKLFNNSY